MKKAKKTPKERFKKLLKVLMIIVLVLAVAVGICACVTAVGLRSNHNFIESIKPVEYENQLVPEKDHDEYYNFFTDDDFNVMQLTDIHIGGGFMSIKKDNMALNAVAAMITAEKPDLVVVTGDIAFPVPFQAGTFNNKNSARLFADLMEQLGVYWCFSFGNHDTESYSYYSRESMSDFYSSGNYPHCLFQAGPKDVDGFGNYAIKVKNSSGQITQALFMLDSHSYVDNDYFGIMWKYDTVHENQVEWYKNTVESFTLENNGVMPKSLCFFHIPVPEYKDAWSELTENNMQDTENVKYLYGKVGEADSAIFSSVCNYNLFDTARELGSTQGFFCGHDHLNNFAVDYKGVTLNYGYSIDYLAYVGIMKFGLQRGCTMIDLHPDGSYTAHLENYYQDKYVAVNEKETVNLDVWMKDAE